VESFKIEWHSFFIGTFTTFVLLMLVFAVILTEGFVSKGFLRVNNIYLDGKYYKLVPTNEKENKKSCY
jgi:hypothetical protein